MNPKAPIMVPVKNIRPYATNPRKHDEISEIVESIRRVGFRGSIWVDSSMEIIAGHGRYLAVLELGMKEVPVTVMDDLTEAEAKYLRIKDNRTSEQSTWDEKAYLIELDALRELDFDVSDIELGEPVEVDDLDKVTEDELPEIPEEPVSERGQIYRLGCHFLMVGDATSAEDVYRLMDKAGIRGGGVAMICTDPPYNVAIEGCTKDKLKIENDKMGAQAFREFLGKAFRNMTTYLREGGAFYIWYAFWNVREFMDECEDAGLSVKQNLIWVKNVFKLGRSDYHWRHEPCLYGWKEGAAHYFIPVRNLSTVMEDALDIDAMTKDELRKALHTIMDEVQTDTLFENKPPRNAEHPTMKPIKLMAKLIHNSSKPGETVMDFFGGSGSTMMACEQLGRACVMMEYDPKYADVIIERWQNMTGERAERIA